MNVIEGLILAAALVGVFGTTMLGYVSVLVALRAVRWVLDVGRLHVYFYIFAVPMVGLMTTALWLLGIWSGRELLWTLGLLTIIGGFATVALSVCHSIALAVLLCRDRDRTTSQLQEADDMRTVRSDMRRMSLVYRAIARYHGRNHDELVPPA